MKIGVPVLTNIDGAFAAIDSIRSAEHVLHFHVVNNPIENCPVAESRNVGCATLFGEGVSAVVVANDDILCSRVAIDALVECWQDEGAGIVAARSMKQQLESDLIVDYVPQAL